jgi:capsule polysaccharide export protein KpsC/LpsZ
MRRLGDAFLARAARYRQVVPVFTNVIFDTSQIHAGTVFADMFAWLDVVLGIIRAHPETLFVIRAHPDEMRMHKESRESVADWIARNQATGLPNVVFIDARETLNSYELIQRSKFVMVYNSTIGLEASIMGCPVLCAGKARYTQYPIVYFPQTISAYRQQAEEFLAASQIVLPAEFQQNARRFLYYQLYRTSLPFDEYLEEEVRPGFVRLRAFPWQSLSSDHSPTMRTILDGVIHQGDFLLPI